MGIKKSTITLIWSVIVDNKQNQDEGEKEDLKFFQKRIIIIIIIEELNKKPNEKTYSVPSGDPFVKQIKNPSTKCLFSLFFRCFLLSNLVTRISLVFTLDATKWSDVIIKDETHDGTPPGFTNWKILVEFWCNVQNLP